MSNVIKHHTAGLSEERRIMIRLLPTNNSDTADAGDELKDHQADIEQLIESAKAEAKRLIEAAKSEADTIRSAIKQEQEEWEKQKPIVLEQARDLGFNEGYINGQNAGYKEVSEQIQFAKDIVDKAKQDYETYVEQAEQTILEIALKAAEKIVSQTLSDNDQAFLPIVKKALQEAKDYKEINIRVNPIHYLQITSQQEELFGYMRHDRQIYIYPDEDLSETSCIIETDGGKIDASIDSQLNELREKLFEIFSGDRS